MELQNEDDVAIISFPEDPPYPRLSVALLTEIRKLLGTIREAAVFHGVVMASNSCSFAVGAELDELAGLDPVRAREFAQQGQALCREIRRFPAPMVAAIRGYCFGGALDLALACHTRIAAYDASFAHPGPQLGLMTGWGGTQSLPRRFGKTAALEMLLTGERIPATQALTLRLVHQLVPSQDLIRSAVDRAGRGPRSTPAH